MPLTTTTTQRPEEFDAIDLASNRFHTMVAHVVNGAMQLLTRLKQRVHLADGLDDDHLLSDEALERSLGLPGPVRRTPTRFSPMRVMIVGTHALRNAVNAQAFLDLTAEVIPYPIEIISSQKEARLIFMGVEHTRAEKGRKLTIDIGVSSTKLVIRENFEPLLVESRRMGCIIFGRLFFLGGEINPANFRCARTAEAQKLETLAWQY